MSFLRFEPRWLPLLAIGCSQPASTLALDPGAADSGPAVATVVSFRTPFLAERPETQVGSGGGSHFPPSLVGLHAPGAWRLASPDQLGNVVVWADQILIRHDAARDEVSFDLAYWYAVAPRPQRTREQAFALAQEVAAAAARAPDGFAELAQRYSEDLPSRDEGGALGGLALSQLSAWPRVLDAFAATRPGQTSNVVETYYGFHIFRRREPPPEQTLSGSHIVIGHDQAEWLKVLARGPLPHRSRDEAQALAGELYRQAHARPEQFPDLVDRYSEDRDAVLGGDFGSWSSREPNPLPQRMRRLEQLAIGEVGAPVETHLGFEVILRTKSRPREQYAMRAARLPFDLAAPDSSDSSRARVFARAETLAHRFAAEPERFGAPGELPTAPLQWPSGRGVAGVELQLAGLSFGEVAASPVQTEFSFQISQRVAPEAVASEHYETELPAPAYPDIDFHAGQMPAATLRELLAGSSRKAQSELRLPKAKLAELRRLHESAVFPAGAEPAETAAAFERALNRTSELLGPQSYAGYLSLLRSELASLLLERRHESVSENGL